MQSQRQPIISKPNTLYEKADSSIAKVHSMGNASDPDLDLLLDDPPLRSSKSASTEADSKDLDLQDQQQLHHHPKNKGGFKGGNSYRCGGMRVEESMPTGEVVINAKPAGVIAAAARAEMF